MSCPKCGEGNPEGAKFCSQCRTDLTDLSGYDQPEAEEKYREILIDLLGDGILEDWEEKSLEKSREKLKISFTRSKQIQEELGGSNDAPPPIAIYLDIAQIKKFQVGGTCVFSFLFKNQIEEGLRSVSLTFEDTDTLEPLSVKTKPIGPNQEARQQKIIKIHQFGAHEITGIVTVVPVLGEPEQFKLEPLLYDVTGNDQPGQTNVTIDMSAARVIDASDLKIGSSTASGASVVTDKDSEWYQLELIRVSAGVQTFKQEQEKLKVGQDTITYDDGSKYVGELKDGMQNGQGTYTWADGTKYIGEWKDGMPNGQCTYTWPSGETYVGEWKDEARNGQGTNTWPDGNKYVGEFKDNMQHGQGTMTYADGTVEEGIWENHIFTTGDSGAGTSADGTVELDTITYENGNKYVGELKDGVRHGQGTFTFVGIVEEEWPDNLDGEYVGEFKDDCYNGQGTMTYADGTKYVGEWKDGMQNGQGTMAYDDWRGEYVGEFKDGMQNGQGTYTYANGSKYVGELKDGMQNGQGTLTYADGEYVGEFKDDCYSGQGTETYADGSKYVGEWRADNKSGQGTYTFANGNKYVGEWMHEARNGQGTMTYADGSKYVGEWRADNRNGQGTYTWADGTVEEGIWKDNIFITGDSGTGTSADGTVEVGTITYDDGSEYVGELKDGVKHGQGTTTYDDGTKHVGEWKDGCLKGQGTYTSADGETYVGEFYKNKSLNFKDGSKYEGGVINAKPFEGKFARPFGKGLATLSNGDTYVGEWKMGLKHGQGTYTYADGKVEEGIYKNSKFIVARKIDSLLLDGISGLDDDLLDGVLIIPLVTEVLYDICVEENNWMCGNIHEKKLKNAIKAYGTIEETRFPPRPEVSIENEQAVALIDATIFGSAKEGIMFGSESGIYYNSGSVKGHVPYSELAITPEDEIYKGKDGGVVVGVSVLKCFDEAEADRLLKALLELRSKLRDAAGLNDD